LYRLDYFEEDVGTLHNLVKQDGMLVAHIGKIFLLLPMTTELSVRPHIGKKIAILRTDLPGKEYLVRVIPDEPACDENLSV
jgi:hypothetical protein